jgi:uncharacterized protein (TIGR00288 family)
MERIMNSVPNATRNMAVLLDYENLGSGWDVEELFRRLVDRGRLLVKRAYADWVRYPHAREKLMRSGVELIEMPAGPKGKNRADIRLAVDAMEIAITRDYIDTMVIVSGDSDFLPLLSRLREFNRYVIVLARSDSASSLLAGSCDELILLSSLAESGTTGHSSSVNGKHGNGKLLTLDDELLDCLWWASRLKLPAGSSTVHLSVLASGLKQLFPSLALSRYGLPKSGGFRKLAQAMDASGWWELRSDKGQLEITFATSFLQRYVAIPEPEQFAKLRTRVETIASPSRGTP